jgi:hypothetical protein
LQETRVVFPGPVRLIVASLLVDPRRAITTAEPWKVVSVEKPNLVLVLPAGIMAAAGIVIPWLVVESITVVGNPPLLRVIVQEPPEPALTLVGLQFKERRLGLASNDSVTL